MNVGDIFGYLFEVGSDVLSASIDATTGIITAQFGDAVKGSVSSNGAEVWQTWGYASLPSPPANGQNGAQCIAIKRGVLDMIIAGRDARAGQIYGNLKSGEFCVFATGSDGNAQGRILGKQDGSVTLFTTDTNTSGGNAVFLRVSPTKGLEFVSPWGKISLGPMGFHVTAGSSQMDMGSVQGLPGPLSAVGAYFTVTTGMATLSAPMVMLGPSLPLGYNPVSYGILANPLTTPGVPIVAIPFSPTGLFCSSSVFIGA